MVVEADGNYVKPFIVDDIDIYSGESYSVLLTTNQDPKKNYWISVGVRRTDRKSTRLNSSHVVTSRMPSSA